MMNFSNPSSATVLLVDNDRDDRAAYVEYLQHSGFSAIATASPAQALQLAPAADIVVTGIGIRGAPFDGLEFVRRLRACVGTSKPVIVLTAWAADRDRRKAQRAGCDLFLSKPCLPDQLLAHIQDLLLRGVERRAVPA